MSREARDYVWALDKAGWRNGEIVLLLALAERADASGRAFPSLRHLRRMTGMARRELQRWLRRLEDRGLRPIARGGGRHKSTTYLVMTVVASADRKKAAPAPPFRTTRKGDAGGKRATPATGNGGAGVAQNRQEPPGEPSSPADAPPAHRRAAAHRVVTTTARKATPDPRVRPLLELFCQTHEAALGGKYLVHGPRDAGALKRALAVYDEAVIRRAIGLYFGDRHGRERYGAAVPQLVARIAVLTAPPGGGGTNPRTAGNLENIKRGLEIVGRARGWKP